MTPKLFYFPGNANLAPHMVLEELGVPYELVLVDRAQNAHKSADYMKLNPMGRIPTYVDGDLVISETAAICLHLADKHHMLAPALGTAERGRFYSWLMYLTNTVQAELIFYFYPEKIAQGDAARAEIKASEEARVGGMFDTIEQELADGYHIEYAGMKWGMFFVGEYVGVVAVSALIVTLYFGGWQPLPYMDFIPSFFWFAGKTAFFIMFFVLVRGSLMRPRYDLEGKLPLGVKLANKLELGTSKKVAEFVSFQSELRVLPPAEAAGLAALTKIDTPVAGGLEQTIFWVNQILRFGKFLAVLQPVAGDPAKTAVTAYMTLGIKADVLDRKKEYERVPVLRNLLPAQVLMGNSSFNTGTSISAGLPTYARNRIAAFADALAKE